MEKLEETNLMVIGAKETFIIRVLMKKAKEAGVNVEFVPWNINDINSNWKKGNIICIYMDEGVRPDKSLLIYLSDKLSDEDSFIIPVGDSRDVSFISDNINPRLISRIFTRPVDNDEFVSYVKNLLEKVSSGELKKSILVVDDDASFLGLVREWLKDEYKVSMVSSGLQAIKFLGKNKVDLILLDHEMPVTTGPQVLEMLRSDPETSSIPVMFLTGKGDKESVMQVLSLKPEGYFLKNISREELLEKLKEYFVLHK